MSSLVFDLLWRDHGVERGLKNVGSEADKTAAKWGKFRAAAGVAALAAGAAILKFGKDSVAAYSEAETSQQQLAFTLAKFPRLADTNQKSLQALNGALQLKTKYDDDAIASGQAVLGSFNMTGKQLESLTPLLLDFATKTGRDLPTAAKTMGQAFLGNTRALKEIGINYKSTGDKGKDFANITALIRKQVGGLAESEGQTAAGQLAILQNQFGELQEAAGAKLLPSLVSLTGWLTKGVMAVGEYAHVLIPVTAGVGLLAGGIWAADKAQKAWAVTTALSSGLATRAVGGLNALKVGFTGVELTSLAAGRAMRIAQLSIPVVGIALFGVTTAMAAYAGKTDEGAVSTADFGSAMQSVEGDVTRATAALNENVRAQAVNALQSRGAYEQAQRLGISYQDVTDAALGNQAAIGRVNGALRGALSLNPQMSKANSDQRKTANALAESLGLVAHESIEATEQERIRRIAMGSSADATQGAKTRTEQLADAQRGLRSATKALNSELQKSIDKMTILRDGALSVERANVNWEESLDGLRKSTKENGRTLDSHTAKGRANRRAIVGAFEALDQKTRADYKNAAASKNASKEVAKANERYRDNRRDLRRAAEAAGYSRDEVNKMIRQYLKTPKKLETDIRNDAEKAEKKVDKYNREVARIKRNKDTDVDVNFGSSGKVSLRKGGRMTYVANASGGILPGWSPGRDIHRFYSATGGVLDLSGGEPVLRPEVGRVLGKSWVDGVNRAARTGGVGGVRSYLGGVHGPVAAFASGGQVPSLGPATNAWKPARAAGRVIAAIAAAEVNAAAVAAIRAARAAAAAASSGGDGGYTGPVGGGASGIRRIARSYNPSYIAGHRDPQGGPAFDIGSSGAKNNNIANALRSNHGRLGLRYVISRMRIASGRSGWRWRGYSPITNRGDWRHVNHVHVSYDQGGMWPAGTVGVNASKRPERVLTSAQNRGFERLVGMASRHGGATVVHNHFTVNAPHYVGAPTDLVRALTKAESLGQLDALKRLLLR